MPLTLAGAKCMGDPHPCKLSTYFRTLIYEIPGFIANADRPIIATAIKCTSDFKASIVVDPHNYIRKEKFSDHYERDRCLREKLEALDNGIHGVGTCNSGDIFLVIEYKEDMDKFPVVDGQCVKQKVNDVEVIFVVDCDGAIYPSPDERVISINAVLTAVKMEYQVTGCLKEVVNGSCYLTEDGKVAYGVRPEIRAELHVKNPLEFEDISRKSKNCRNLVVKIEEGCIGEKNQQKYGEEHLEKLIEALQRDPSTDDSYLRLWYVRLWERLVDFGKGCSPSLRVENDPNLKDHEKRHRDDIAHWHADKIDKELLRTLQLKTFDIIKHHLGISGE